MRTAGQMVPGWNLGNTLEATGGETAWQPTVTTRQVIDFVKAQGFRSVRIPCSWDIHCDEQGVIDAAWMQRVCQVVDYCLANGLYVVLNDHWDGGWIETRGFSRTDRTFEPVDEAVVQQKLQRLQQLWTQIARAFRHYDERLLFAGLNEPFQNYTLFHDHHQELTPILMRYNQAFVHAVRATGGRNAKRLLVVQAPATNAWSAVDEKIAFQMPADPKGAGRLLVEIHYYDPWQFCGQEDNGHWFWGAANHVDGSDRNSDSWCEEGYADRLFSAMQAKFVDAGYPVLVGEYGVNWRQLPAHQPQHDASVLSWFRETTRQAVSHGCVPMLWDINRPGQPGERGTFTVIDRERLQVFCRPALDGIRQGVAAAKWPVAEK